MNKTENYKHYFEERGESEPSGSDSSQKKSNPSDKYLYIFSENKWENIPDELKNLNQWVTWKAEKRDSKKTKVPYQPNGKKANVSDSSTWSSFDDVKESDKIGFVFTDADPYVFIDIDGNKETGSLSTSASFWISKFNSYTEYSPSKIGFHIIIKGEKNGTRCKRGDFEIYENSRFATFTGDIYQNHTAIESRQDELDRLQRVLFPDEFKNKTEKIENEQEPSVSIDDLDVLKLARKSIKFRKLWTGDISSYQSRSEADLALCGKLAYYTKGNSDQIEKLFSQSGLARDKWINRQDYRKHTIEKAIAGYRDCSADPSSETMIPDNHDEQDNDDNSNEKYEYPKPIPLTEIMQKEFMPRKDVIKDLIPSGLTLTMSAEKIGKSSMFRQVGYSVATGGKCFGGSFSPAVSGHVLYLSFEDDDQSIQESMELFCQNSAPPNYQFQYHWKRIGKGCIRALESYMRDFPYTKLIIIDTWAYIRSKDDGNTSFGRYNEDVEDLNVASHDLRSSHFMFSETHTSFSHLFI